MLLMRAVGLVTVAALARAQQQPAASPLTLASETLTLYHVNPQEYGPIPLEMNTADVVGDMFFDWHNVILVPLECPHGAASGGHCSNPEAVAPNLVVNKVIMEVATPFSSYAKCNIGVNGSDGHGNHCPDGTYCCICTGASHGGPPVPCNATLGREEVKTYFGRGHRGCRQGSPAWQCYEAALPQKLTADTPGYWYSSIRSAYCGDSPLGTNGCTWRVVQVAKVVSLACQSKVFYGAVEKSGQACFTACGADSSNTSSPCWVDCFYKTVLGPGAAVPGGAVTGVPLEALVEAWTAPFESEDPAQGGCPALKPSPGPAPPPPAPAVDCNGKYTTKATCDADAACAWCTSAAVPAACNTLADARSLPPSVFTCDKI